MIDFRCTKRDKNRTPIVRNEELWEYAESHVGDYKPSLLKEPGAINSINFLESYLGANVDYQDIYYNEGESPIAGATVFNDDRILVFNREGLCVNSIDVPADTIILDNATMKDGSEGFALFTALHEGGHFSMHKEVYKKIQNQISFFDDEKGGNNVICCRKSNIGRIKTGFKAFTPEMSREHQANVYAAFVAMPRQTFIPLAHELIKDIGFEDGIFIYDDREWESDYALGKITEEIHDVYGVSKTAAKIHLKELKLMLTKDELEQKLAQATLF